MRAEWLIESKLVEPDRINQQDKCQFPGRENQFAHDFFCAAPPIPDQLLPASTADGLHAGISYYPGLLRSWPACVDARSRVAVSEDW